MRPFVPVSGLVLALLAAPLFAVGEATTVQVIPQPSSAVVGAGNSWTRDMGLLPSYSSDAITAEISPWINAALAATNTPKSGTPWTVRKTLSVSAVGEEGYRLTTSAEGWTLDAATDVGLYYGVQTARQLLNAASGSVAPLEIEDVPAAAWRGVMYDHARNFLGADFTRRLIDQMGALKLNRLHLHLTDDQGWRIPLPSYPELTTTGASSSTGGQATWGAFTREEWLELDAYAQKRGVVLVPEIDLPGHTHAVKSTYSSLGCGEDKGWPYTGVEVGFNNICNNNAGKNFIATALEELADMTSGPYVHIGGDECLSMSSSDYSTLVRHAESTVNGKGKIAVGWSEAANGAQSSSTILQKWKADGGAPGANWINSTCSVAYIDHPEGESTDNQYQWSTWCTHGGAVGAQSVYGMEAGTAGVEAALWSEYNYSAEIAEAKLFPRIVALAENGWTPAARRNWWTYSSNLTALGESFFRNVPAPAESDPVAGIERAPVHTLASARPVEHVIFAVTGRRIAAMAAEEGVDVADQMRNGVFAPGTYVVRTRWSDGSASGKRIVLR